ncbi:hypothetical protein KTO58_02075 [Chitinophaga pendula]|uniref:hypothetical protein n=1 Tax=Chitinophaga TaxID=79328 RepID=UPI000BB0B676|nr:MULTISPECIES: hypothetical protein [Chitinophaga]ASZ14361.1 hypothetical protein CK934_27150 [Chitinophaga sp. MD30]UCJ07990.1 hypothetical protein KTO58_02075 [Chitinophaga pendula]
MRQKLMYISLNMILAACFSPSTKLFEVERRELVNISVPGKDYRVGIYYISGNATTQNCIQVMSFLNGDKKAVLKNYMRYNMLDSYKLINDTSLMLVVRDTISYLGNQPDTFFLSLK